MAKGFANLNRFKHSQAVKGNSKLRADLHSKNKSEGRKVRPSGQNR